MSAEATGWVYRCSPYTGVRFAVHHAIADSVNDQNADEFWMRQGVLAKKARTTRGTVNAALAAMIEEGFLVLLEEGRGGANRYRFLMPEGTPTVYDPRSTLRAGQTGGVRSRDTGVSAPVTGGARSPDTEPKGNPRGEPKGNPTSGTGAPGSLLDQGLPLDPDPPLVDVAKAVTDAAWEAKNPRPTTPWIAARKLAEVFLAAGWPAPEVQAAMIAAPTWTKGAIEFSLNRARGSRPSTGPRAPVAEHRDAPEGRVAL